MSFTIGNILLNTFIARGLLPPHLPPQDWDVIASDFLHSLGLETIQHIPARNWKAELKKYGRHLPSCPTGAPCTCGFAEIEGQL